MAKILTPAQREWKDHIARWRHEADKFGKLAAQRRLDAQQFRRQRQWLKAIEADDRAAEYRKSRDDRKAEIRKIREIYGI